MITLGFILGLSSLMTFLKGPDPRNMEESGFLVSFNTAYYITSIVMILVSFFLIRTGIRFIRRTP